MKLRHPVFAAAIAGMLILAARSASAAPPVVEIVAMAHPPVKMALAPLRTWLAAQGGQLKVIETDVESPQGEKRLQSIGLAGHVPIVILIDGQYRHKRKDGTALELLNFPAVDGAPAGVRGAWTTADVEALLKERMKRP